MAYCLLYNYKMRKVEGEKDFQSIREWIAGVRNHLYWAETTRKAGFEDLIEANWTSFIRHAAGKHEHQPNAFLQKCLHDELEPRKWIRISIYLFAISDIFHGSVIYSRFYIGMSQIDGT